MTRWLPGALALLLLAAPLTAQVRGVPPQGRRAELMERIHDRFMDEIAERLGLDEDQKERVSTILRETMEERRELAREGVVVRQHFLAVARDSATSTAELERSLDEMRALRRREFELAEAEDDALARVLTPRQHAELLLLRHRFNQRVHDVRGRMGRQAPPGPPDGPGRQDSGSPRLPRPGGW